MGVTKNLVKMTDFVAIPRPINREIYRDKIGDSLSFFLGKT